MESIETTLSRCVNFKGKLLEILNTIFNVELCVFLYCVALGIWSPAQQRFIYQQSCLYTFNTYEVCMNIDNATHFTLIEGIIQSEFASVSTISTICSNIPVTFVILIFGEWVDRFSVRIPLAIPHIGCILLSTCNLIFAFLPVHAIHPYYYGLVFIFLGLGGTTSVAVMAGSAYISRTTEENKRTFRFGFLEAAGALGLTIGYLLNSIIMQFGNTLLAFAIQISIHFYTICYIFLILPEIHTFTDVKEMLNNEFNGSWIKFVVFPRRQAFDGFRIFFGCYPKYNAKHIFIVLLLVIYVIYGGMFTAMSNLIFDFLKLEPISLNPPSYSLYRAIGALLCSLSLMLGIPFFRKILKFSDAGLLIIGLISHIMSMVILGFGGFYPLYAAWISSAIGMFAYFPYVSVRSGLSKLVDESEHGRIFAVLGLIENIASVLYSTGFNSLYATLVATYVESKALNYFFHGFTLLFGGCISIIPLLLTLWLGCHNIPAWSFGSVSID